MIQSYHLIILNFPSSSAKSNHTSISITRRSHAWEDSKKNIAVATRGASGIGQAIVCEFTHHGATVILVGIQTEPAMRTVNEVTQSGGRAQSIETALRNLEQIDAIVRHTVKQFGHVDIMAPMPNYNIKTPSLTPPNPSTTTS